MQIIELSFCDPMKFDVLDSGSEWEQWGQWERD